MNARDTTAVPRAAAPVHPTHKFKLLLQRENGEHKGGFLWAPLIAGGISLLLTGMMSVFGLVAARRAGNGMTIDGVSVNGLDIGELTRSEEHTSELKYQMRLSYAVFCLKKKTTLPIT